MKLSSKLISGDRGDLNEFSFDKIDPQRIFIVSNVPPGSTRGYHAHIATKQYLCCVSGNLEISLDDGSEIKKINLKKSECVFQDKMVWAEIKFIDIDSVLMVICSTKHDEKDYIRDYNVFKKLKQGNIK